MRSILWLFGSIHNANGIGMTATHTPNYRETLKLWPYRSLSQQGFLIVMGALGGLAFCVGLGFFLLGAWPVIGFLGLEILVVWAAFKLNYRSARHRQTLTATADDFTIETVTPDGDHHAVKMPTAWLRVERVRQEPDETPIPARQRLFVSSHGKRTEIGGFLHPAETEPLANEVESMLDRAHAARLRGP